MPTFLTVFRQCVTLILLFFDWSNMEPVYRQTPKTKGIPETNMPNMNCGYRQCHQTKEGALNVHIIPHSHMDAGWVKTFDQYYYGTRTASSTASVQLIYHSVMTELQHDKRRKFVLSETSYFWKWWKEQKLNMRNLFRRMVQEGRIEIVGGGWVQSDEAVTHYQSIIDQYTWGLRRINDTLGRCGRPKAAWQIDTYGHSRETANLLAQMGFDGLFLGRVDYKYREDLMDEGRMDMIWRGSDVLGKASDIFTNVMFNLYNAPEGFCFDFLCTDEPIMDDLENPIYNADRRADEFITMLERQARFYDFDNILVPMGGDFTYQSAANWFVNIDKLMTVINARQRNNSDINVFYSTPSCYLKAIYLEGHRDKTLYSEKQDFFPYGSDVQTFWTGFYSSRPALKYLERVANNFLQIAKQLTVLAKSSDTYELHQLRTAVALMQHHDAITGTSQDHVAKDYARSLTKAMSDSANLVVAYLSQLITNSTSHKRPQFPHMLPIQTCQYLNISECTVSEQSENFVVMVYNPMTHPVTYYVRLPVLGNLYTVRDSNDEELEIQIVPLPAALINIPGRKSKAIQELVFEAAELPPLGYSSYYISLRSDNEDVAAFNPNFNKATEDTGQVLDVDFIANKEIKVQIDTKSGMLQSITLPRGVKFAMTQNFFYYTPSMATANFQTSGAYSFRPQNDIPLEISDTASYKIIRGPLVEEIHQRFSDWVSQVIRVYRAESHAEFEWIIGPIPVGVELGKEVVTRFTANLTTNGVFYTDANGRQMIRRASWSDRNGEPVKKPLSANFYPVTTKILIRDTNRSIEVALLTDRPQGGTSLEDGEIEMMVHRRILTDDGFGMEEPLNEEEFGLGLVIKGQHFLMAGDYRREEEAIHFANKQKELEDRKHNRPWVFVGDAENLGHRKWSLAKNKVFSALNKYLDLPPFIKILTLEPWRGNTILLRLENTLERDNQEPDDRRYKGLRKKMPAFEYYAKRSMYMNENDEMEPESHQDGSTVVRFDLRKIFTTFKIKSVKETTLAANQWLREARQMDWSSRFIYAGADDAVALGGAIDAEEVEDPYSVTTPFETSDATPTLEPTAAISSDPASLTTDAAPITIESPTSNAPRPIAPAWTRKSSKQRQNQEQAPYKRVGSFPRGSGVATARKRKRRSTTSAATHRSANVLNELSMDMDYRTYRTMDSILNDDLYTTHSTHKHEKKTKKKKKKKKVKQHIEVLPELTGDLYGKPISSDEGHESVEKTYDLKEVTQGYNNNEEVFKDNVKHDIKIGDTLDRINEGGDLKFDDFTRRYLNIEDKPINYFSMGESWKNENKWDDERKLKGIRSVEGDPTLNYKADQFDSSKNRYYGPYNDESYNNINRNFEEVRKQKENGNQGIFDVLQNDMISLKNLNETVFNDKLKDYFKVDASGRKDYDAIKIEDDGLFWDRKERELALADMTRKRRSLNVDYDDEITKPLVELYYAQNPFEVLDQMASSRVLPPTHQASRAFIKYSDANDGMRNASGRLHHRQSGWRSAKKGAESTRVASKRRSLGYNQGWGVTHYQRSKARNNDRDNIYYDEEEDYRLASRPLITSTSTWKPVLSDPEETDDYNLPLDNHKMYGQHPAYRPLKLEESKKLHNTKLQKSTTKSDLSNPARKQIQDYLKREESQDLHHQVKDKLRERLKGRSRMKRHSRKPPGHDDRNQEDIVEMPYSETQNSEGFIISLRPTQIRTFVLTVYYP